jgi:hypothetical protein
LLEREFGGAYSARHFTELGNYEVCVKILVNREHGDPFFAMTLPPVAKREGRKSRLTKLSRGKYGTLRQLVEDKIDRWMQTWM